MSTLLEGTLLTLDARYTPGLVGMSLAYSTLLPFAPVGERPTAAPQLRVRMSPSLRYGLVKLAFADDDIRVLEVYRAPRAEIEAMLRAVRRRVAAYRRRDQPLACPEGEQARVTAVDTRDLDGDGVDEVLATVSSQLGPDWFCRWTEVFARADLSLYYGVLPYGVPALTVRTVRSADGAATTLIARTPEGTARQHFVAYALVNGHIVRVANLPGEADLHDRGGTWRVDVRPDGRDREGGAHWEQSYVSNGRGFVDPHATGDAVTPDGAPPSGSPRAP